MTFSKETKNIMNTEQHCNDNVIQGGGYQCKYLETYVLANIEEMQWGKKNLPTNFYVQ